MKTVYHNSIAVILTFLLVLGSTVEIQAQQRAEDEIPRPEHPKPQFERTSWKNLNGTWDFAFDHGKSGVEREWYQKEEPFDKEITVPFPPESELSGIENEDFMPSVWYHREFEIPEDWNRERIFVHFGAVDYEANVWINGKKVGRHLGAGSSFSFEITDHLSSGTNDITVQAVDEIRNGEQPAGKQSPTYYNYRCCRYSRVTGIWQTVWLEARPNSYIESVHTVPKFDSDSFFFMPVFDNATRQHDFRIILNSPEGDRITSKTVPAENGGPVSITLEDPQAWSPDNPYLYDIDFELLENGQAVDQVDSYAGLRKFHIEGNEFYLNNEPIFLRLVLDQGFYPEGIWTAPSDKALKQDIELAKKVGFHGARLHEKVFEERFHYWADKLGYLTWGEFHDWGSIEFQRFTNQKGVRNLKREWAEIVKRDRNHPSIIAWTPLNETHRAAEADLDNYRMFAKSLYDITKSLDPTRPVNDASGYVHVKTDIYTIHDYDPNPESFRERYQNLSLENPQEAWRGYPNQKPKLTAPYSGQPYMVDEYGGIFWTSEYTDQADKAGDRRVNWGYGKTSDQVMDRIEALTEVLLNNPNIAGYTYTQLTDIEQEVNGIYTYDREPKFDAERLREIFQAPAAIEQE